MASPQTTQADRVARSLKRLGFRLTRISGSFTIIDSAGGPAAGSKTRMTLAEIERWIGEHIKPKRRGNVNDGTRDEGLYRGRDGVTPRPPAHPPSAISGSGG